MASLEERMELEAWNKSFPFTPASPSSRLGLRAPEVPVNIKTIPELKGIVLDKRSVSIGAGGLSSPQQDRVAMSF